MKTHRTVLSHVVCCFLQQWGRSNCHNCQSGAFSTAMSSLLTASNYLIHIPISRASCTESLMQLFFFLQNVQLLKITLFSSVKWETELTCIYTEPPHPLPLSFRGAKVGLVCSHVWLGHLLAHTNDPNWESGLRFRVTDRLTGMWGMWPGGTRLLSGPPYQLAAYCNGHLPSCLSPQAEKLTLGVFKVARQSHKCFACAACVCVFRCSDLEFR